MQYKQFCSSLVEPEPVEPKKAKKKKKKAAAKKGSS
jgi:hypothetical protein